ncbi:desmoplakin [Diatraea saccharalis granulovirus]|uniref:Desmoplakin n=1 Tax=Diatraea saccharalis granulovirus TaxID=1675862 RepID=A0A0R7EYV0_9BBAC|nr:desmoplakin [Diatraea saccharalis granulovirus]AKN80751.1 desmoplakin [Diatraea saccharalis granulovirus]
MHTLNSSDMLTRYRGVDVTPHTFNNLVKTVASNKNNNNSSSSRTKFEERMRDIILSFNPALKKTSDNMSTEYLLISSLKFNDKKEVVHTYNYNNWDQRVEKMEIDERVEEDEEEEDEIKEKLEEMSRYEWENERLFDLLNLVGKRYVKKIKKRYKEHLNKKQTDENKKQTDENNTLVGFKTLLGVKKLTYENCSALLNAIKRLIDIRSENVDTVEMYTDEIKNISKQLNEYEKNNRDLQNEISKIKNTGIEQEKEVDMLKKQLLTIKTRYEDSKRENEDLIKTVTETSMNLAKMGADIGQKDELLEQLKHNNEELLMKYSNLDSVYEDTKLNLHQLDGDMTEMMRQQNIHINTIDELKKVNTILDQNIQSYERNLVESTNENKNLKETISCISEQLKCVTIEKLSLEKELKETIIEKDALISECNDMTERKIITNNLVDQKETELKLCKARLCDKENELKILENDLEECKRNNDKDKKTHTLLLKKNETAEEELNKLHEEMSTLIEENCKLQTEYKKLLAQINEKKGVKRKSTTPTQENNKVFKEE